MHKLEMRLRSFNIVPSETLCRVAIGAMLILASDARSFMHAQLTAVDSTLETSLFPCAGLRGKLIESVPLRIVHGLPVISVQTKNHEAALFLLDSGSEKSFLNTNDVSRLGFKLAPAAHKAQIRGIAAVSEISSEAKSIEVFVGKKYRIHGDTLTIDLNEFNRTAGVQLSGVIGYDILRTRPMALDYKNKRFLIYKKITAPGKDSFASERIDSSKSLPIVASSLIIAGETQGQVTFAVDTGNDVGALVGSSYSESHDLAKIDGWKRLGSMGFNGSLIGLGGLRGSVTFGGQTASIASIVLSGKGAPAMSGYDLSVGYPVFADRCLLFDVPKGQIYLSRDAADAGEGVSRD